MNVDALVAIDMHVHAEISADGHTALPDHLLSGSAQHFNVSGERTPTIDEIADYYRSRSMAAVVFTVDAQSATGTPAGAQ